MSYHAKANNSPGRSIPANCVIISVAWRSLSSSKRVAAKAAASWDVHGADGFGVRSLSHATKSRVNRVNLPLVLGHEG